MKPLLTFLLLFLAALTIADQKYLVIRQPTSTTQVAEPITVPPFAFFLADSTGKLVPRIPVPADIPQVWGAGSIVSNYGQLQAASVNNNVKRIILANDILMTGDFTLPNDKTLVPNGYKLLENTTQVMLFYGTLEAPRSQVFQNWEQGDIRGDFGSDEVFPEWWGLTGSNYQDGQHDIAINSAIKANIFGLHGLTVSLAAGEYWVSKPLDLRGTHCRIKGAGSGSTQIYGTTNWAPVAWDDCDFFGWTKTRGTSTFSSASNNAGNVEITTPAGGTAGFIEGDDATISGSSVPAYNGTWEVLDIIDHNSMVLDVPYSAAATGSALPVTLDSVMESGAASHSSLIWMGGTGSTSIHSFHTGVERVSVNGYYVVRKWPLKRISCISWTGFVEELSIIKDITCAAFSGFGIGGSHPSSIGTTNGLSISNFNMYNSTRRGACPVHVGPQGGVHSIRDGTLDMRIGLAQTRWAPSPPTYEDTWPQFGILCAGAHTIIENVHIEGCGNGIHIFAWDGPGSTSINGVDMIWGMERNMRYYDDDTRRVAGPAPAQATQESEDDLGGFQPFIFHYGCLISLGTWPTGYQAALNYNSSVSITNARTIGNVKYVMRDWMYEQEVGSYGNERFPNQDGNNLTSYIRGIPYGPPTGTYPSMVAGALYNRASPPTDKVYFSLVP